MKHREADSNPNIEIKTMNALTTTYSGREYTLEQDISSTNLKDDLIARGFDGSIYYGTSPKTQGKKKVMTAMFYRNLSNGCFCFVC